MIDFSQRKSLLWILALVGITLLFTRLDSGGLPSYDDAYYAQKSKELLQTHDFLTMHFNGSPAFDNPPGLMWLQALSFQVFGVTDFGAQFPSALSGLLAILGTFYLFELVFSTRLGFMAAAILSLTTIFLKYSRHAMMDAEVTACVVWGSYAFLRAQRGGAAAWFLLSGLLGSYVFFMKSLFGVFAPTIFALYLVSRRDWASFKRPSLWAGLVLSFVPYVLWSLYNYKIYGDYFVFKHFQELLHGSATHRQDNDHVYDYVIVLLKYFPHFLPFMVWGLWICARERREAWFPLIYFSVFFLILSTMATTKTWYFLPAFPACAALAAVGLDRALKSYSLVQIARVYAAIGLILFFVFQLTNVPLAKSREVAIRAVAPYVHAAREAGFDILGLDIDPFGINNALLWYGNVAAASVNAPQMAEALAQRKSSVLMASEKWAEVARQYPTLHVVKSVKGLTLVSNAPLETSEISDLHP